MDFLTFLRLGSFLLRLETVLVLDLARLFLGNVYCKMDYIINLKKKFYGYKIYSALLLNIFNIPRAVIGTVTAARITPSIANSLTMTRVEIKAFI